MRKHRLDITIFAAGLPFDGDTIPSGVSLGGSETAALQVAEELARQGNYVSVFSNCEKPGKINGVWYCPIGWVPAVNGGSFPKGFFDYIRSSPTDLLVVSRLPSIFQFDTKAKVHFLWQHDLATKTGPSQFQGFVWNIDKILVLSEFQKEQYKKVHGPQGAEGDKLYGVTRNGIDLNLIDSVPEQPRDRFRLTYTARPERGLDILLTQVFPKILNKEPRAKLYISRYQDPSVLDFYRQLEGVMKQFGDRVEFLGHLGKKELYDNYRRSRLYIYPSVFEEISCITSMEVSACGAVFLGPWRAALPETIGGAGVLVQDDGSLGMPGDRAEFGFYKPTPQFVDGIVREALKLIHDDEYWGRKQAQSNARARAWTWKEVAEQWTDLAHERIAQRTSDPRRVLRHFIFNSDIVAAKKFVQKQPDGPVKDQLERSVSRYVQAFVPWMGLPDGVDSNIRRQAIAAFYEQRSGGDNADYRTAFWAAGEARLQALLQWMRPKVESGEIKTVLDFACAHGGYAKALVETFPQITVVGTDVSKSLIRCAEELKATLKPEEQKRLRFVVGDEDADIADLTHMPDVKFDLVVAMEVLEHVPHSEEMAKKLERWCKPDGWMTFTVPHGHRERDEFVMKQIPPVHVRSFDLHDLRELFGKRKDYGVTTFSDNNELVLDCTFAGWFMCFYRNDGKPVGEIDYERKFFLQGPRETVAVCMILNNCEDVLHRCLRSVVKYADQLIVIDNGPSRDRTVEVAEEYGADVRAGTSPFWCYTHLCIHPEDQITAGECDIAGFETPRNESVEGAWTDWILWIDDDEQLLEANRLPKYLRPNELLGYAVKQHHISIDMEAAKRTDIPVRLYRNIPEIRCYGKAHEHFELGINRGVGTLNMLCHDFHIHHDGYLTETIRRGRFKRNLKLLECDRVKYPDRMLGYLLFDIRDSIHQAHYELERNGRQLTPQVEAFCMRAVEAYRKHFIGSPMMYNDDAINYYSEALSILGQGVEFFVQLGAAQQNVQPGNPMKFRAWDAEEAKRIIGVRIDQAAAGATGPYLA